MDKKQTVFDDLKDCKGYILGVVAFATGVGAFMTEVMGFRKEPTTIGVAGVAICMLFVGMLINRSEKRQMNALKSHQENLNGIIDGFNSSLKEIKDLSVENRLEGLRTLLTMYINTQPENHDTILKIAQRYFIEYEGDWVMTDEFLKWADSENEKGRPVHVPAVLSRTVEARKNAEKDGML